MRQQLGRAAHVLAVGRVLDQALDRIAREIGTILFRASVHETAPIGAADQSFLNTAVLVNSPWEPAELMRRLALARPAAEQAIAPPG